MGISFTDTQVKDLSLTTLQMPLLIDNPTEGTGLIQQKAKVTEQKVALAALDDESKIFTDFWISVLASYHAELELLDKTVKTPYTESIIQDGGAGLAPHYPEGWTKLVPKVADENTGLPTSVSATPDEADRAASLSDIIDKLVNGFGGAFETTLDDPYTAGSGSIVLTSGSLTPGDLIIIDSGGSSMLALVGAAGGFCTGGLGGETDAVTCGNNGGTWTATTSITPLSPDTSFGAGARVRNYHAGFTNAERGHQGADNYAVDVQEYWEGEIDTYAAAWRANLASQLTAVSGNEDNVPANVTANNTEETSLTDIIADHDTWAAATVIASDGKYTDSKLPLLTDNLTTRDTERPARIVEVNNSLGTLVQAGDGSVSGSGAYASLYEFVSIRISKSGGYLWSYNTVGLGEDFFTVKIDNAQNQLTQYNNSFAIATIVADTEIGQIDFEVDSVSEFSIGQTVKVMDNASVVYTRVIDNIVGTVVTLDSGIPAELTLGEIARIVRVK